MNAKSQSTEKIELFSEGTSDSQHLRYEIMATANHQYVKILIFNVLDTKFWIEEDNDLHKNHV